MMNSLGRCYPSTGAAYSNSQRSESGFCFRVPLVSPHLFGGLCQQVDDVGISSDEPPLVGTESQEAPHLLFVPQRRRRLTQCSLQILRVRRHSLGSYDVQVILGEMTLFWVGLEGSPSESLGHFPLITGLFLELSSGDDDVILVLQKDSQDELYQPFEHH